MYSIGGELASEATHLAKRGVSDHLVTIELPLWQNVTVSNQICTLHRWHLLWNSECVTCTFNQVSIFLPTALNNDYIPWSQHVSCSVTSPFCMFLLSKLAAFVSPHLYMPSITTS